MAGTKKSFRWSLIVLLIGAVAVLQSCNITKQLNRQKSEMLLTEEQNVLAKSIRNFSLDESRISWQVDSSDHHYRVSIQPTDIFTYSPQQGFSGRASNVEIEGYIRSDHSLRDSSARAAAVMDTQQISLQDTRLEKQDKRSTIKEKEHKPGLSSVLIVLMVLVVLLAAYFVKRYVPFWH